MLSLLSYKAMDAVSSGVLIPTTVILSVAILVSTFNISASSFSFYWNVLLSLAVLSTSLIKCITGFGLIELLYIFIP